MRGFPGSEPFRLGIGRGVAAGKMSQIICYTIFIFGDVSRTHVSEGICVMMIYKEMFVYTLVNLLSRLLLFLGTCL